jgi:hypothetical protein
MAAKRAGIRIPKMKVPVPRNEAFIFFATDTHSLECTLEPMQQMVRKRQHADRHRMPQPQDF